MAGFEFNGMVANAANSEPSAFDVFNNAIAQGTQSIVSLVNSRNTVRAALNGGQTSTGQPASGADTPKSGGVPSWVLFAVLGVVLVKVLK